MSSARSIGSSWDRPAAPLSSPFQTTCFLLPPGNAIDADKTAYGVYFEHAFRMLRKGGVMAFDNALWHDRVADLTQRDAETTAVRDLGRTVRADARLIPALLPVSDGLLVAAKR